MKPIMLLEFDDLTEALDHTELKLHASQVHGLISGLLCGNFDHKSAWDELLLGEKLSGDTKQSLQAMFDGTAEQLSDFLFEFKMVLPSDDEDLSVRAEALGVWCQGYLTGLQTGGVPIVDREPGELTEAINDLVEIAKMNYEQVVASEEDEEAYTELVEYVRMAVIYVYQELHEGEMPHEESGCCSHHH